MAYKGIEIETITVDLGKKELLMDDYLAITPRVLYPRWCLMMALS
jgi:glutathione S-transferase